jgi:hypothetical protein
VESPNKGSRSFSSCAYQLVRWLTSNSPHAASIHILNNDSLLHVFYLYRPLIFDGNENFTDSLTGGIGWDCELWWYNLAHVCQRWRNLIFGSASYLGLCLVCTFGTPVADMLAHSPAFPLAVDYSNKLRDFEIMFGIKKNRDIAAEDEEGIMLALEQRDRVRRIRFVNIPLLKLQKFIMAMDEEYPVLEYLILEPPKEESTALMFPNTLQAPHLLQLALFGFVIPVGSRLLTTAMNITTLSLVMTHPSAHFQLQWITFMPQLETLTIISASPVPNRDVERQLMHTPITAHVTLPNLRKFIFRGVSAYMEAVVRRIATPRLEFLGIVFFNQLTFSVPRLIQFMNATENLRFDSSLVMFSGNEVHVRLYREKDKAYVHVLIISVFCQPLDWQVSLVAQFFNSRSQISPAVDHLTLKQDRPSQDNEVDRAEWHKLLRSFNKVKTLHVDDGLVKELARSLRPDDEELPPELLPELQELRYSGSYGTGDAFTPFIDARRSANRPVNLVGPISSSVPPP